MVASKALLLWSPRVLGILVSLFLGLFALDAFSEGKSFVRALPDFAMHLLPALVLLVIVGLSWRWEWVGGLGFTGLAATYAYLARSHPAWIVVISGPLLIVGILFWRSWRHHGELRLAS